MLSRPSALPAGFVEPCLPTSADQPPSGDVWLHEIKWDGFRVIARKTGPRVKLYSRPGNDLIKKQNPEMTDALLAYSIAKMKEYGIVDSGDSQKLGIGAMTDAHWKSFFDKMVRAGVVKPNIDYKRAYTLQFVNKRVGVDLRSKN